MRNKIEAVPHINYFNFPLLIFNVLIIKKHLKNYVHSQRRNSYITNILHHTSIRKHFCWAWLPKCNVFKKKIFLKFLQECYGFSFIYLLGLSDNFICIILRLASTKINNLKE